MMSDDFEIQRCEPAPFLYFENGQMAVTDGASMWLVIVTCEVMKATVRPPEMSLRRLVRFAEIIATWPRLRSAVVKTSMVRSG
jgi:hypothetical protein